jgi:hypothetical protein
MLERNNRIEERSEPPMLIMSGARGLDIAKIFLREGKDLQAITLLLKTGFGLRKVTKKNFNSLFNSQK